METLILLVDTIAVMVVLFYSLKNEKLPEGAPEIGFFRIRSHPAIKGPEKRPEPKVVEPMRTRRSRAL